MYIRLSSDHFDKSGFVTKEVSKTLSAEAQVITYLKNKDKSTNYKYLFGVGECRTRLLAAYAKECHGMPVPPKQEVILQLAFDNFKQFKKWLNNNLKTF